MSVSRSVILLVLTTFSLNVCDSRASGNLLPHSYEVSVQVVGRHVCAGAIISPRHVLTAAHCFEQNGKKYPAAMIGYMSVVSGINGNLSLGGHAHKIHKVTTHRDMSRTIQEFWISDIALVTLETEISYSTLEQPIELAEADLSEGAPRAQMSVWTSPVESLQITDVELMSHGRCKGRLREKFLGEHEKKICGHTRAGRGFCLKNDGSPLVQKGKLIGIASKSEGCFNGNPDIYTSVYRNVDFINQAIALNDLTKLSTL